MLTPKTCHRTIVGLGWRGHYMVKPFDTLEPSAGSVALRRNRHRAVATDGLTGKPRSTRRSNLGRQRRELRTACRTSDNFKAFNGPIRLATR